MNKTWWAVLKTYGKRVATESVYAKVKQVGWACWIRDGDVVNPSSLAASLELLYSAPTKSQDYTIPAVFPLTPQLCSPLPLLNINVDTMSDLRCWWSWHFDVVAEVLDALFLQLFKLTWGQSHGKERAWGAGQLVAVVAVCTECLCVCEREMDWHCWTCWVWRAVRWLNTHIQDSYMPCNGCYSQVM